MSFYLKHVTKQKYNSYNYVKINVVFTPNSRGLWHHFESGQPAQSVLSDQALYCWLLKFIFFYMKIPIFYGIFS